ncbi:MAG: hypothetical protein KAI24_12715 [Planctomycetes bacterium]|nr:hypothetical protein [Planctomycetota bacterium]
MNRTTAYVLSCSMSLIGIAAAQQPAAASVDKTQDAPVAALVASMVKAEQALKSLRMRLRTSGRLPGGLDVSTTGELRVLRGTQPGGVTRRFTRLEYAFGDGLRGRLESAETAEGILLFEEDPAFGAVFVRIEPAIVADLEWAGTLLDRDDLPGMGDARARAPLGSGLLAGLRRTFDLKVDAQRGEHGGHQGTWIVGARKPGLDDQNPDLPLADRVEVFVRAADRALLLARYLVGDEVLQQIEVDELEIDGELPEDAFVVDGHGVRIRNVQDYAPMWEQIEKAVERAEEKADEGVVRPSRRPKPKDKAAGEPGGGK